MQLPAQHQIHMATSKPSGEYLAQPPSDCCFVGKIHKGTPRGEVKEVVGVPTYVARPTDGTANGHVVLYFPDVWGLSNNAKLVMDGFADGGFLTLGMDYFRGVRSTWLPSSRFPIRPSN